MKVCRRPQCTAIAARRLRPRRFRPIRIQPILRHTLIFCIRFFHFRRPFVPPVRPHDATRVVSMQTRYSWRTERLGPEHHRNNEFFLFSFV